MLNFQQSYFSKLWALHESIVFHLNWPRPQLLHSKWEQTKISNSLKPKFRKKPKSANSPEVKSTKWATKKGFKRKKKWRKNKDYSKGIKTQPSNTIKTRLFRRRQLVIYCFLIMTIYCERNKSSKSLNENKLKLLLGCHLDISVGAIITSVAI